MLLFRERLDLVVRFFLIRLIFLCRFFITFLKFPPFLRTHNVLVIVPGFNLVLIIFLFLYVFLLEVLVLWVVLEGILLLLLDRLLDRFVYCELGLSEGLHDVVHRKIL